MKLTFHIPYKTAWGERLCVLMDDASQEPLALNAVDGYNWSGTYELTSPKKGKLLTYRYAVFVQEHCTRRELGGIPHTLFLNKESESHYIIYDVWRDLPCEAFRYSSAFAMSSATEKPIVLLVKVKKRIEFRALSPGLSARNCALGISGSCGVFGNWEHDAPVMMREISPNVWHLSIDAEQLDSSFDYKFVAVDRSTGMLRYWEENDNRHFGKPALLEAEIFALPEVEVCFSEIKAPRVAGSAIPVFSLRSEGSCGVGDFGDLYRYIEWASHTGQKAVQILPINDTTMTGKWTDSYPYAAISIYAFHPMFVDLRQLPELRDKRFLSFYRKERLRLNTLSQVDYEAVNTLKREYLKRSYLQDGATVLASQSFLTYFRENKTWLSAYAAFRFLAERNNTPLFKEWGEYAVYNKEKVARLVAADSPYHSDIAFYYYVQYILHCQLTKVAEYARRKGVILKGDIPIGVNRESVEVWTEPHYFHTDVQVGAPPDAFSEDGQNWGFPSYNWEMMARDGYRWWKQRFAKMSAYFTAYRIDHILGFFRVWEIPKDAITGLTGQFSPSLPLTEEEIRSFGMFFERDFMTYPFINEELLIQTFGEKVSYVKATFLEHSHYDVYRLKKAFDTQRKLWEHTLRYPEDKALLRGLYTLVNNVLFIEDKTQQEKYHPRIVAQTSHIFTRLKPEEQAAFNRLYQHYYYERHNEFWYREAMKKLPVLTQTTPMLPCGEDLGMVPECVAWVMRELQLLSLEIERMPKETGVEFGDVRTYPHTSVATTGTHDMDTFRAWWEEDASRTERYYHAMLYAWGTAPQKATARIVMEVLRRHLASPSLLCILPWQDWMGIDETLRCREVASERINIPADAQHYWRWRMHLTIEQLMESDTLNNQIRRLIEENERI